MPAAQTAAACLPRGCPGAPPFGDPDTPQWQETVLGQQIPGNLQELSACMHKCAAAPWSPVAIASNGSEHLKNKCSVYVN